MELRVHMEDLNKERCQGTVLDLRKTSKTSKQFLEIANRYRIYKKNSKRNDS
jgi:hypothetical protein